MEQSKLEKEDTDRVFQQHVWISANRTLEPVYHLYFRAKFQQLNLQIDGLLASANQALVDPEVIEAFQLEQARLNDHIGILRKGFLPPGESTEGMQEIEQDLKKLQGMIRKYLIQQRILNQYTRL